MKKTHHYKANVFCMVFICTLSTMTFLLAGCGNKNTQEDKNNSSEFGVEEAKEAALQHAGLSSEEVTFLKSDSDLDDGKQEYEIEFVTDTTKYEYEIQAADGSVTDSSKEPIVQIPENMPEQEIISVDEAKAAILKYAQFAPEQVIYTKVELEQDYDVIQYEIEFFAEGTEYEGTVDAATGTVWNFK